MNADDRFNVENLEFLLKECQVGDDDVLIENYLQAYEEINKFFSLMGTVFTFVSSDVRNKIDIVTKFLRDEAICKNFYSIKTMIAYEKESGLLKNNDYVSGSRTVLRLHRGFEFLFEFLRNVYELENNEKTHNSCKNAYNKTLAKHHPFLIRKGALVAMYALPTKAELLKKVCHHPDIAIEKFPGMLNQIQHVYDRCEYLYTIFDCHNLP